MNKNELIAKATRSFYKVNFKLKKHSPELLVGAGIVGVVTSAVMACKATTKVQHILNETNEHLEAVHTCAEQGFVPNKTTGEHISYTDEDVKRDVSIIYAKTGLKFVKLYGPSVALGTLSLGSIVASHHILKTRNVALAAAYTAVDTGFKEYRGRVVERFGEALDKELKYNIKAKEVEETVVDEDGNEKTVKKTVEVADRNALELSPYTFCFDETARGWTRDADHNKFFLARQQDYANELLRSKGIVFLNEVLDMVGIDRVPMGQRIGWCLKDPNSDGHIDFGVLNIRCEANRNFVNGLEKSVWLDFNVDGYVDKYLTTVK